MQIISTFSMKLLKRTLKSNIKCGCILIFFFGGGGIFMNMETLGPDNFSDRTIEGEKVMRKNIRKAIIL